MKDRQPLHDLDKTASNWKGLVKVTFNSSLLNLYGSFSNNFKLSTVSFLAYPREIIHYTELQEICMLERSFYRHLIDIEVSQLQSRPKN